jgi:hypothetical protein
MQKRKEKFNRLSVHKLNGANAQIKFVMWKINIAKCSFDIKRKSVRLGFEMPDQMLFEKNVSKNTF